MPNHTSPHDIMKAHGVFTFDCWRDGVLVWSEKTKNVVATLGKNLAFNSFLAGTNYTVTGPYMGLISSQGFTGVSATDTMASHPGWTEAGAAAPPNYSGARPTCVWAPAFNGGITLSLPLVFPITSDGTVEGAFIVFGPGALNTIGNPGGTLWSASVFQGGPQPIIIGDQLLVGYSASM